MGVRGLVRSSVAAIASVLVLVGGGATAAQAAPTDNLDDAKAQVEKLDAEASEIGEHLAETKDRLASGRERVKVLDADVTAQEAKVAGLTAQARSIALLQFQTRGIDQTVQLLTTGDPDSLLNRLSTVSKVDDNLNGVLQDYQAQQANLVDLRRAAQAEVAALTAEQQRLTELQQQVKAKVAESEALVRRLSQAQRYALDSRGTTRTPINVAADGSADPRALAAVRYAVSRVSGGNYVWGAAGPTNFDCSGLTLAAYRSAGVSLPHSSRGQFSVGRPVSRGELKPGDLIFWYSPIHHVGLYIGGGKIVHARNVRADLVIQTLASYPAPYSGARRVLG